MDNAPKKDPEKKPSTVWRRTVDFSKDLWNDHQFWVHALGMKGGIGAIVMSGVVTTTALFTLPFTLAAGVVALCIGAAGVGAFGIIASAQHVGDKIKQAYLNSAPESLKDAFTSEAKPDENNPAELTRGDKIKEFFMEDFRSDPFFIFMQEKFLPKTKETQAWKVTQNILDKQKDYIISTLGMGGAIASLYGAVALATGAIVFPIIAIGNSVALTTLVVLGGVASGAYGIYITAENLLHLKKSGAEKNAQKNELKDVPHEHNAPLVEDLNILSAHLKDAFDKQNNNPPANDDTKKIDTKPSIPKQKKQP
jgi:hypothetical protein